MIAQVVLVLYGTVPSSQDREPAERPAHLKQAGQLINLFKGIPHVTSSLPHTEADPGLEHAGLCLMGTLVAHSTPHPCDKQDVETG